MEFAKRFALIVAGGSGKRMESETPKQFLTIRGVPILMRTIEVFHGLSSIPKIFVVLPHNQFATWDELCKQHDFSIPHVLVSGGETRFQSVKNGLEAIAGDGMVAIHDGVRPLVKRDVIEMCYAMAQEFGNAIPAVQPVETVRSGQLGESKLESRESLWLVQTPQVFNLTTIKKCYLKPYNPKYTDDASVAEESGERILIVPGNRENIKITTQADLLIAEALWSSLNP